MYQQICTETTRNLLPCWRGTLLLQTNPWMNLWHVRRSNARHDKVSLNSLSRHMRTESPTRFIFRSLSLIQERGADSCLLWFMNLDTKVSTSFGVTYMCRFMWRARWSDRENARSHRWHWKGRCPVCFLKWRVSSSDLANFQPQPSQLQW